MMNYEEFKKEVAGSIKDYLPEKYEDAAVSVNQVLKNNDTALDGLSIRTEDSNISPNIYLNSFYEKYQQGEDFSDIMKDIAQIRTEHEKANVDLNVILDYEAVKDKITARLVNRESNEKLLSERPFTPVEDLAVTYHLVLEKSSEGTASIPITNEMMKQYGVSLSELHENAMQNTLSSDNIKFMGMNQVMLEMMGGDLPPEMISAMVTEDEKMYVLTNNEKINGAIAVMDQDTMSGIAEKVGGNFFVLPSSTHEVLIVPESQGMDYKELEAMVREVNSTQVMPEERLSDHVYKFDAKTREFTRADRESSFKEKNKAERSRADEFVEDIAECAERNSYYIQDDDTAEYRNNCQRNMENGFEKIIGRAEEALTKEEFKEFISKSEKILDSDQFSDLSVSHRDLDSVLKNMEKKALRDEKKPSIMGQIKKMQQEDKENTSHKIEKEAVKSSKKETSL